MREKWREYMKNIYFIIQQIYLYTFHLQQSIQETKRRCRPVQLRIARMKLLFRLCSSGAVSSLLMLYQSSVHLFTKYHHYCPQYNKYVIRSLQLKSENTIMNNNRHSNRNLHSNFQFVSSFHSYNTSIIFIFLYSHAKQRYTHIHTHTY